MAAPGIATAEVRQRSKAKIASGNVQQAEVSTTSDPIETTVNERPSLASFAFPKTALTATDSYILVTFTVLAAVTRFYRIGQPAAVVFDEYHFCRFVDRILSGTWFFDIHPPLGKLILAYSGFFLGYRPEPSFVIKKIGDLYPAHVQYYLLRYVSGAFSVLTVPLTYLISRNMQISVVSSVLSMSAVLFDFLGIIEGRLILMDSQLLFFCQLALLCALHLWRTKPQSKERTRWLCMTGLSAGAAFSIKHTALGTPALIAVISALGIHYLKYPLELTECMYAAACGLVLYTSSFFLLLNALWKSGDKYDKFMPIHFQKTLLGADKYEPGAKRVNFFRIFLYLNARMVQSNASIKKRHNWESDWYQWIVNWRGVLYFVKKEERDGVEYKSLIYLFGNPVVILLTLICVCVFLLRSLFLARYRNFRLSSFSGTAMRGDWILANGSFLLCGWLCNLLPYILVDRAAFIYHYLPGLFYGQLLMGQMFDLLPHRIRLVSVIAIILAMMGALVYWSPWIYSFPILEEDHKKRRWLPRWT